MRRNGGGLLHASLSEYSCAGERRIQSPGEALIRRNPLPNPSPVATGEGLSEPLPLPRCSSLRLRRTIGSGVFSLATSGSSEAESPQLVGRTGLRHPRMHTYPASPLPLLRARGTSRGEGPTPSSFGAPIRRRRRRWCRAWRRPRVRQSHGRRRQSTPTTCQGSQAPSRPAPAHRA